MATIQKYKLRLVEDGTVECATDEIFNSVEAVSLFIHEMSGLPHEEMKVVYVSASNKILGMATIAMGGLHGCALTPKDVFRGAIAICASAIILAHNHPSGSLRPSELDIHFTKEIAKVGKMLGIMLFDHFIIADESYHSLSEYCG